MSPVVGTAVAPQSAASHVPATALVQRANPAPYGWQVHVVRPADNLSDLAVRFRTTTGVLASRNALRHGGSRLIIGEHLWVPRPRPQPVASPRPVGPSTTGYRVRSGDTVGGLAARFRTSQATLLRLNHLDRHGRILVGQTLRVPGVAVSPARAAARTASTPTVRMTRVTLRPGDTIGAIAARYRVSQSSIIKANRIGNARLVRIGQVLNVPVKVSPPAYSATTFAGRTYPAAVLAAARGNRQYLAARNVPSRTEIRSMIVSTARRHGVDPRLALAVGWQESGWNQRQVSIANAIGAMQVVPSSGRWASEMAGRRLNILTAQDNITAGVVILRSLLRSSHSPAEAIAGYYQGLASVRHDGMFTDTKAYVRSVLAHRARL